jgi:predicted dienelactone hydrolase
MVDTSRPTAANGTFPGSDERRMTVEIWYPAVADGSNPDGRDVRLDSSAAPYPLIIFAHGYTASRVQSTSYTRHLASHGYVVAAPDFPLTSSSAPGGPQFTDLVNQPRDVSFLIDQMLAFSADSANRLTGGIDGEHIGLTGHSLGGFTTLLAMYGPDADPRIDAALPLSASGCFMTETTVGDKDVPIMLMTGSEDLLVAPAGNRRAYDLANAPRYWVQLNGGGHVRFADADIDDELVAGRVLARLRSEPATGAAAEGLAACTQAPAPSGAEKISLARQQELLRTFATPFFDAYLRESESAKRFLQDQLPELTSSAVQYEFDAP